jgi:hypothetical protein
MERGLARLHWPVALWLGSCVLPPLQVEGKECSTSEPCPTPYRCTGAVGTCSLDAGTRPVTGTGLKGDYFSGEAFGSLKLTRLDDRILFDWGNESPDAAAGIPADFFSVRWTGAAEARFSELYRFTLVASDGVRLWVNGSLIVSQWTASPQLQTSTGTLLLTAGERTPIELEYFESGGFAAIELRWSSPSQTEQVVPQSQLFPPL